MSDPWYLVMAVDQMTFEQATDAINLLRHDLLMTEAYTIYRDAQARKWAEDGQAGRRITDVMADQDRLTGRT